MRHLSSLQNPIVKSVVALQNSKVRKETGLCVVEGVRAITTFLQTQQTLIALYATHEALAQYHDALPLDEKYIKLVAPVVLKKMSTSVTPSGLLAVFKIPQPSVANIDRALVLAQISDPGNMGTMMRTAVALGLDTAFIVEGVDPWSPKVIQATAGTIAQMSIITCTWPALKRYVAGRPLAALVVREGKHPRELPQNAVLVVGNEARGLPDAWINDCALTVTIPMPGGTESLNAAVAASIALYVMYGTL